jgi:Uma2 family endonuclease
MRSMPAVEPMNAEEFLALPDGLIDTSARAVRIFSRSTSDTPSFDVALELDGDDALSSPRLPGFELPLSELFPEPE